uniref:Uncharacterized protein n=1 Tax=Oryza sativa subsp. japonica TaxID=39947 RepID=Q69NE1_ORYSJ|nr:hypothetical protein [Oryza sativa Japonica Group]
MRWRLLTCGSRLMTQQVNYHMASSGRRERATDASSSGRSTGEERQRASAGGKEGEALHLWCHIHAHPELAFREHRNGALARHELEQLGLTAA